MLISVAASDSRIAAYASVKDRDLAARDGLFVVEGQIALGRLISSPFFIESLLLAKSRVDPLAPLLAKLHETIPVYVASQDDMDAVTGFHIHRGVLALARRGAERSPDELLASLPQRTLVLALAGLVDHDNIGACFRNAAGLGADAVLLDETSADPLYRKSIRVSSGNVLTTPFARARDGAAMLETLARSRIETWALSPTGGEILHDLVPPDRLAILLGAEGPGLPDDLMARARRISIPMAGGVDSLNVATAGAIALAHVAAHRIDRRS